MSVAADLLPLCDFVVSTGTTHRSVLLQCEIEVSTALLLKIPVL
jgi:hypothetical protein